MIEDHVPIAKEHILPSLPTVLMPPGARVFDIVTAVLPFPVTLDYFVSRAASDLARLDRPAVFGARIISITSDMTRSP